tara:strand:- start:547 stop:792 length:246 start_codon:yes stop_codon:yes gene_type:complete
MEVEYEYPKGRWRAKYDRELGEYKSALLTDKGVAPRKNDITICCFCKKKYIEWRECHSDLESYKICKSCNHNRWSFILGKT